MVTHLFIHYMVIYYMITDVESLSIQGLLSRERLSDIVSGLIFKITER